MSSTQSFTGAPLKLESVEQIGLATIRVRYTTDPLTASTTGAHDALNIANYAVTGPSPNYVLDADVVSGDPQAVDLNLAGPLVAGTWTVAVSNVRTATGTVLTAPTQMSFTAVPVSAQEGVSRGATSSTPEDVLRDNLNPYLKGPAWDALITALATGDTYLVQLARAAMDQIHVPTASGLYLDRRLGNDGIVRPANIGMPDDLFRRLGIAIRADALTQHVMLEVLEVFYGSDAVRAHAATALAEPFNLYDGDDLLLVLDKKHPYTVVFSASDFAQINNALAVEVAMAITRSLRAQGAKNAFALPVRDAAGAVRVYVYTDSLGLGGGVQVVGGKAQNGLQFPSKIDAYGSGSLPTWNITKDASRGVLRFTVNTATGLDLSKVAPDNYVCVFGPEFQPENCGTFVITATSITYPSNDATQVPVQWFEVSNLDGVAQAGLAQIAASDLVFYSADTKTIHAANNRTVVVSQSEGEILIVLPATTQAVGRSPKLAAYLRDPTQLDVVSLSRDAAGLVTAVTSTPHFLSGGGGSSVVIDGARASLTPPVVHPGNLGSSIADASITVVASLLKNWFSTVGASFTAGCVLPNGKALVFGGASDIAIPTLRDDLDIYTPVSTTTLPDGALQRTYSWTGGTSYPRVIRGHGTVPMSTNVLLSVGGISGGGVARAESYTYDTTGGGWVATANTLTTGRYNFGITKLTASGTVFVAGGFGAGNVALSSCEKYTAGTWGAAASMAAARANHSQTLLGNGTVLVAGGENSSDKLSSSEVYSPGGDSWATVGSMSYRRRNHAAVLLPSGDVLVVGGFGRLASKNVGVGQAELDSCELYNPPTGRWRPAGRMSVPRGMPCAWLDSTSNRVYVFGSTTSKDIDVLDLDTMRWSVSLAKMPYFRQNMIALPLDSGAVLLAGGDDGTSTSRSNTLFLGGIEQFASGGMNGLFSVMTVVDSTTFQYVSPVATYTVATGDITATPCKAAPGSTDAPGPFVFDTDGSPTATSVEGELAAPLVAGNQYTSVQLGTGEALRFPDEDGWLCFGFGTASQVYPVRYFGRLGADALLVDYDFKLPKTLPAGTKVMLLSQKGVYVPDDPEEVGSFYLTASSAGRVAAAATVEQVAACGVPLDEKVVYPGDRGLAGEGLPQEGAPKLSDKVAVWAGDDVDAEVSAARSA